jgi:hypothetical protein
VFDLKEVVPPKEDAGFTFAAASAIDVSLKDFVAHFEGEQRPYNVAVLPAEKGQIWVYLVPAPTKPKVWTQSVRCHVSFPGPVFQRRAHQSRFQEISTMTVIHEYTQAVLLPQLRSLALSKPQRAIVVEDVSQRLESLLSHWSDLAFRRTILMLGTEEASFWEPYTASLEIRSLVVVSIRNSLIEDLGALHPYTKVLESRKRQLEDEQMPSITSEATKYFETANLDAVGVQAKRDVFGDLPRRFPNAWHALLLLSGSSENEIECELPIVEGESMETSASRWKVQHHNVVASGIDPRLDAHLVDTLRRIKLREAPLFFRPASSSSHGTPRSYFSSSIMFCGMVERS